MPDKLNMKKYLIPFTCTFLISCSTYNTSNRSPSSLLKGAKKSCKTAISYLFETRLNRNRIKNHKEAAYTLYREYFKNDHSEYFNFTESVNSFEKFELLRVLLENKVSSDNAFFRNAHRFSKIEQIYNLQIILESKNIQLKKTPLSQILKAKTEDSVHLIWSLAEAKRYDLLEQILKKGLSNRFNNYSTIALSRALENNISTEEILKNLDIYIKANNPLELKLHKAFNDHNFDRSLLNDIKHINNQEDLIQTLAELGLRHEEVSQYTSTMPKEFLRDFSPSSIKLNKSMRELFGQDLNLESFDTGSAFSVYKVRNKKGNVVAVFKPSERPFTNFRLETDFFSMKNAFEKNGRQYRDKVFYELNVLFNLNMVPPSSVAESSHFRKGNVIAFLHNYTEGKKATTKQLKAVKKHEAQGMYLLDIITGHQDRHSRNWLIGEQGDVKLIDNDLILHRTKKVRWRKFTKIDKYLPQAKGQIDKELADKIMNISSEEFSSLLLRNGIPPQAIKYAVLRLEGIQEGILKKMPLEVLVQKYQNLSIVNYKSVKFLMYGAIPTLSAGAIIHEVTSEE